MPELGNCTMDISAESFMGQTEERFIQVMSDNYSRVSDDALTEWQVIAWRDCFRVLQKMLGELPEQWRKELWMVFEYVLPTHAPWTKKFENENHSRADVIFLTDKKVMVLEFKKSDDTYIGNFRQTGKYKRRLRRFHARSRNMWIYSVLVLTKATGIRCRKADATGCSPDRLAEVINHILGTGEIKGCDSNRWIHSGFIGK